MEVSTATYKASRYLFDLAYRAYPLLLGVRHA